MMKHRRWSAFGAALLCGLAHGPRAFAADAQPGTASSPPEAGPSRSECLDAHRAAQELRKGSKLLESQEQLLICSSEGCPGVIITDCGKWLTELDQLTPSIAFEVTVDGKDNSSARVDLDGRPLGDWSQAVKVNPGRHDVRVSVDGFEPYVESVLTPEGQRLKMVSADFKKKEAPAPLNDAQVSGPRELRRPTPAGTYVLLGLGVLGAGGFVTFAAIGKTKQNQLDNDCRKVMLCTDSDLKPMKNAYLVGDISAGVGAAALIGAAVVYFTRPALAASGTSFQVGSLNGSKTSFGILASHIW